MKLIFEKKSQNRGEHVPNPDSNFRLEQALPAWCVRKKGASLPEVGELDVVRHFTKASQRNFCVDTNFYPLGSCTMKYNPKVNDQVTAWPFYARIHPYQPEPQVQGILQIIQSLEDYLCQILGMDAFSLQPAAGAQGEFAGLLIAKAYHEERKNNRTKVLIPDSAHGTNPASAALCGYEVIQVKTDAKGRVDIADLKEKANNEVACLMMTNPNTLGLFETNIKQISQIIHDCGGLVYYDGANMNALLGIARPGDMGFDIVHVNLHKTFAVPHGSGGPGSGPVGVKKELEKYLPFPRIQKKGSELAWDFNRPHSIGRLRSFYGNVGAYLRSYCYIQALGKQGLRDVSEHAVLNANYLKAKLKHIYHVPHEGYCMHEFVASAVNQKKLGVKGLDIAKRLLDYGIHAPTVYFPLIVEEALMIEPTETEPKEMLDHFIQVMNQIDQECRQNPEVVLNAPSKTPIRRIDEVQAARKPNLRWSPDQESQPNYNDSRLTTTNTCCA